MTSLKAVTFPGPAGILEGLWKDATGPRRGGAVFAHPHPLHGGSLHSKVVYRAAKALTRAGWETLRFNFRGVGLSSGVHDFGRGETEDYRAALEEAQRVAGIPLLAGGFSFGSAAALEAIAGDARVVAYVAAGYPVATESAARASRPGVPALFVVGERDTYGPVARLREFVGDSGQVVVIPGADHFFEGKLAMLEETIFDFASALAGATVAGS